MHHETSEDDIAERKRVETDLGASEARYRRLFESAKDGILILDAETGRVDDVNPFLMDLLGYSHAEFLGKSIWDLGPFKDIVASRDAFKRLQEQEYVRYEDLPLEACDGRRIAVEFISNVYKVGSADVIQCNVRYISERKRAARDAAASETRYRRLFECAQDGILIVDAETGAVEDVNPFLVELSGFTHAELVGRKLWEFGPFKDSLASERAFRKLQANEYTRHEDLPLQTKDGRLLHVELVSNVYQADSRNVIQCNIRDISERRGIDAERARENTILVTQLEASADGVLVVDERGKIVLHNQRFARMWQIPREVLEAKSDEAALESVMGGLVEPEEFRAKVQYLYENHNATSHDEISLKDGRHLDRHSAPMFGADGTYYGRVWQFRDISERWKLEAQVQASQKLEAIGLLAGGVAHDFNNILSVILSYTECALDELREGDPLREDLVEVKTAAQRATALTRQLLAFGHKQVFESLPLDLNGIVTRVERMLGRILGEGIDLVLLLSEELGVVRTDAGQMDQVLVNLAINARDAMPEGGTLTIETSNVEIDDEDAARRVTMTPGSYVLVSISDTGRGMDEQIKSRLFEPFFTTKERDKGTGLGLSTVYGIVKQSGGSIWVYSELGRGTTFKIYLPREYSVVAAATAIPAISRRTRGTETILVVEDEAALRRVAGRSLEAAGYTVLLAANGEEAVRTSSRHRGEIHVLLTDVVMPKMSGKTLAQEVSRKRPTLKVVYMSGYTDDAIVHHGVLDAGKHFVRKPFTGDELTRKIRDVLDTGITVTPERSEQVIEIDAELNEPPLDWADLRAFSEDVLGRLRHAVVAARHDEIIEIVETMLVTQPGVATALRRMADCFDLDGMRTLLGQGSEVARGS